MCYLCYNRHSVFFIGMNEKKTGIMLTVHIIIFGTPLVHKYTISSISNTHKNNSNPINYNTQKRGTK